MEKENNHTKLDQMNIEGAEIQVNMEAAKVQGLFFVKLKLEIVS